MRVALLYLGRKGGAVPYSFEMTKALLNEGIQIFAVLSEYISNKAEWVALENSKIGLTVTFIPTYRNKQEFIKDIFHDSYYKIAEKKIVKFNPDAIYLPMISLNVRKFKRLFNRYELITTIHDFSQHPGMKNPITERIFRNIEKLSKKFVVLTKTYRPLIANKYSVPENLIAHIPHPNFSYYNKDNHIPDYSIKYKILFFGRITKYKGLSVLLEAMEKVIKNNSKITLTVVGNGDINKIERQIINKYPENIQIINRWIDDAEVWDFFSKSDVTILPYIEASQSGVVAISFSCGRTVIATDTGGLRDQVTPGGGIIVPPNDVDALANAILSLYRLGEIPYKNQLAFEYANSSLSWNESAQKLIDLIRL